MEEEMMGADIFDDEKSIRKMPEHTRRGRRKKSQQDFFSELKIKMLMRIHGATRARAIEILAEREAENEWARALSPDVPL